MAAHKILSILQSSYSISSGYQYPLVPADRQVPPSSNIDRIKVNQWRCFIKAIQWHYLTPKGLAI